jgi:hypothetical protein
MATPEPSKPSGGGAAGRPPTAAVPVWQRPLRLLRWLFPAETDEVRTSSGYATDEGRTWFYPLAALVVGLAFAGLWEWVVQAQPIPPGFDPSTWLLSSYAFVGIPQTSTIQPLAYPPAAFPFVGISVLIGGGPLLGGKIYMGAAIVAVGLATYLLARSLLVRPPLALLAEGFLLGQPDFQQLYYFGGYPNMFAYVFLTLALAFFVRYLRSRKPEHLLVFWVAATVTVLAHSLTAAVLLGILAVACLGLLIVRRLPRTLVWSRAGAAGVAIFAAGVGGYYGTTAYLGIGHPAYLQSSTLGTSKAQLLPAVLHPFYVQPLVQWFIHQPYQLDAPTSVAVLTLLLGGIAAAFVLCWTFRRRWITLSWLIIAGMFATVALGSIVGYELSIPVDYRRFPYFLYAPLILTGMMIVDAILGRLLTLPPVTPVLAGAVDGVPSASPPPIDLAARRSAERALWKRLTDALLVVATLFLLIGVAQYYTEPAGQNLEAYYTLYAHDQTFINAVNPIAQSGIPGNIIASTTYVGRWPSALTSRATFDPSALNGNSYEVATIANSELVTMTLTSRLSVTNTAVVGSINGVAPGNFNASPTFSVFDTNLLQPLLYLPTASIQVGLFNGALITVSPLSAPAPPVRELAGGTAYGLTFYEPGFVLTEVVTAVPQTAELTIGFTAVANASAMPLAYVQARLVPAAQAAGTIVPGATGGTFDWYSVARYNQPNGTLNRTTLNFTTFGAVTPSTAFNRILNATPTSTPQLLLHLNATNLSAGASSLSFQIALTAPSAANAVPSLGPFVVADWVWANWTARFILIYAGTVTPTLVTPPELASEYGAAYFSQSGLWTVMLLPSTLDNYPSPASGPPP